MIKNILIAILIVLGLGFTACSSEGGGSSSSEDASITHNGVTYKTVTSPYTGAVWLDRNLGASQVCTALDDVLCYGDYYQWGRNFGGHENNESTTIDVNATQIDPVQIGVLGKFIITSDTPYDWTEPLLDDDGSIRSFKWSKTDGTSVCPIGFSVPTIDELTAETLYIVSAPDDNITNNTEAFENFLKLPSAGYRNYVNGSLGSQGSVGFVWVNSVIGSNSRVLIFNTGNAGKGNRPRAYGLSVRCFKD